MSAAPALDFGRLAVSALLVTIGYLWAVIVSVLFAVWLMELVARVNSGAPPGVSYPDETAGIVFFGLVVTFFTALPGFAAALSAGCRLDWRSFWPYALAGTANAILAMAILHGIMQFPGFLPMSTIAPCLPAGFIGGAAYWLSTGRLLARRRHDPR